MAMDFDIRIYPIINSQGDIVLELGSKIKGHVVTASVPVGTSVGEKEAISLPLNVSLDVIKRYDLIKLTKDALKLLKSPREFDTLLLELDDTPNKQNIGGNVTLLFSVFYAKAFAVLTEAPLYKLLSQIYNPPQFKNSLDETLLLFNVINGGKHGYEGLMIQEFKVAFPNSKNIFDQIQKAVNFNRKLKKFLRDRSKIFGVGLEGGYIVKASDDQILEFLVTVASRLGYSLGTDFELFLDVAAGEYGIQEGIGKYMYKVPLEGGRTITGEDLLSYYLDLLKRFPIRGIEDPFAEEDLSSWAALSSQANNIVITGDDITATNAVFIERLAKGRYINNVIIKPNQVGTLLETYRALHVADASGITVTLSHRSRETNDTFLSHIVASCNSTYLKTGNIVRGERVEKFNELIRIRQGLYL